MSLKTSYTNFSIQMKDAAKSIHRNEATDNNDYIRVQIPPQIAEHLNIQPRDTLAFQTEYSNEYGEYASFWNQTKQQGDE